MNGNYGVWSYNANTASLPNSIELVLLLHFLFVSVVLLREEVLALQEEVAELKRMKEMLNKELDECGGGCSAELLSAAELRVQLSHRERDLDRATEALQGESTLPGSLTLNPDQTPKLFPNPCSIT